ncbi:hypothetical protein CAAN1_07S06854 [[Candida] anglica]|uniref:Uncharacterized protein n=1 Tax=[Candida] anglica TaxID=148631 RepID=A0ABP0EEA3_9ASCO
MVDSKKVAIKFVGITAALAKLKARRPILWAAFLTLHPAIKAVISTLSGSGGPCQNRVSNAASAILLYLASHDSVVPKDYISLYFWMSYILGWADNHKSNALREKSPNGEPLVPTVKAVAANANVNEVNATTEEISTKLKDHVIFTRQSLSKIAYATIFGQLLSQYLSPTHFMGKKHLNGTVKSRLFDPVWFQRTKCGQSLNWKSVGKNYLAYNIVLATVFALAKFRSVKEKVDRQRSGIFLSPNEDRTPSSDIWKSFARSVVERANTLTNLVFVPNLIAIGLVSLSGVSLPFPDSRNFPRKWFVKLVGFSSVLLSFLLNSFEPESLQLDPTTLSVVTMYLFRLVLLSKWRTAKDIVLKGPNWNVIETALMSYGVYTYMNKQDAGEKDLLAGLVGKIM